ncbi:hypothetical protein [Mycoplasma crocodyli]|uniref:Uncharacterized protein n=1 Tax=Mycoplasma crocodyli (strain ATCC 51981 / MP145) TaxID=512564 RepID=D5E6G6_MYCCM|nr:hypothetical protein [Mycoplasma crocodyli]ADE19436.1 conserved hypothetical protein [Mycoplasma crocodyli MP145]
MNTELQTKKSKELNLSFSFAILDYHNRHFTIELGTMLRDINYSEKYCEWFMEDLLFFLEMNGYQLRFDVSRIKFTGIENLRLSAEDKLEFVDFLTNKVTNFKITV